MLCWKCFSLITKTFIMSDLFTSDRYNMIICRSIIYFMWSVYLSVDIFDLIQLFSFSFWFPIVFIVKWVKFVSIVWSKRSLASRFTVTQVGAYGEPITGPHCAWRHVSINSRARWLGVALYRSVSCGQ